jgi:putative transposase
MVKTISASRPVVAAIVILLATIPLVGLGASADAGRPRCFGQQATRVGGPERGYDGAKRLAGRKRHILVDTNGLVLAAKVHGADLPDRDGGRRLVSEELGLPRLELLWADGAYTGGFREWLRRQFGWRLEVPHHPDRQLWRYGLEEKPRGFQLLPRRWVVERTFAWLGLSRRLSKETTNVCQRRERL